MKNTYFLLLVFFAIITSESYSQHSISPRLGEEIDSYEREYFGLFPNINGFKSARTNLIKDSVVEFDITRSQNGLTSDTTFKISSKSAKTLAMYIDGFELVRLNKKTVNWELMNGMASSSPAIENKMQIAPDVAIETIGGEIFKGRLLFGGDSSIALWKSSDLYNWNKQQGMVNPVRFSEVNKITIKGNNQAGIGAGIGLIVSGVLAYNMIQSSGSDKKYTNVYIIFSSITVVLGTLVGGVIGSLIRNNTHLSITGNPVNYRNSLPTINENSIFSAYPPPELIRITNK